MFFANDSLSLNIIGVFSINRTKFCHQSSCQRQYDSISIRISGESIFNYDDSTHKVTQKDILYLPQNLNYTQKTYGEKIIAIHFANYDFTEKQKPEIIRIENFEEIRKIMLEMYNLWNSKEAGYKHECTSLLYHLLYIIKKQTDSSIVKSAPPTALITNAVEYIHKHYKTNKIMVSDLAKMVSLSEVYFRKIFKKIYGVSPNKYINNLRLELAAQLLQSKLYSVSEVSEYSGFTDVKYFTKCFKQKYGLSPNAYKTVNPENFMR